MRNTPYYRQYIYDYISLLNKKHFSCLLIYLSRFCVIARRNNWPPLPEKCCFQPCFYQDIDVEIHTDFQKIVRHLYYLWMCKFGYKLCHKCLLDII